MLIPFHSSQLALLFLILLSCLANRGSGNRRNCLIPGFKENDTCFRVLGFVFIWGLSFFLAFIWLRSSLLFLVH